MITQFIRFGRTLSSFWEIDYEGDEVEDKRYFGNASKLDILFFTCGAMDHQDETRSDKVASDQT